MRQVEHDGDHIWLRQSVTFTVNGQTRTVEIAVPLRPGAAPEEIEALLSEADAGMERLSLHLDARIEVLLNGHEPVALPAPAPAPAAAPAAPATSAAAPAPSPSRPPEAATPAPTLTPTPATTTAEPAPTPTASPHQPSHPPVTPSHPAATPAARQGAAVPQKPQTGSPSDPLRGAPSGPLAPTAPASPAALTGDISRAEFLAAAADLGLNARQAMDRLNVRSLAGLNLREALEMLRRQMLREDTPAAPAPAPASVPTFVPAAASAPPTQSVAPRYFEEEDEPDITFTVDDDGELSEELGTYDFAAEMAGPDVDSGAAPAGLPGELDDLDDLDLDDVPDFGPPPTRSAVRPAAPAPAARPPAARRAVKEPPAPASAASLPETSNAAPANSAEHGHALQLIGQLRGAHSGGSPTSQQRTAYRNIVVRELGEPETVALVRGLWRVTPERLGPEQLDALISWGKRDTFAEEVGLVLAALRAERARAAENPQQETPAPASPPAPAPRPTARGRANASTNPPDRSGGH